MVDKFFFKKISLMQFLLIKFFLKRYEFQVAEKNDFNDILKLRNKVYVDEFSYSQSSDIDEWDDSSLHLIAKHGNNIIGYVRLIKDNPNGFRSEEYILIPDHINRSKLIEPSRLIIDKAYRGGKKIILIGLLREMHKAMNDNGFRYMTGTFFIHTWRTMLRLGMYFDVIDVGEATWPKNSKNKIVAFLSDINEIEKSVLIFNPYFAKLLNIKQKIINKQEKKILSNKIEDDIQRTLRV